MWLHLRGYCIFSPSKFRLELLWNKNRFNSLFLDEATQLQILSDIPAERGVFTKYYPPNTLEGCCLQQSELQQPQWGEGKQKLTIITCLCKNTGLVKKVLKVLLYPLDARVCLLKYHFLFGVHLRGVSTLQVRAYSCECLSRTVQPGVGTRSHRKELEWKEHTHTY